MKKIAFFSTQKYEKDFFEKANQQYLYELHFLEAHLNENTAVLCRDFSVICCFANDQLNKKVLDILWSQGVRLIALRSAGFNHVDLAHAKKLGFTVVRVPTYSPHAIAEHSVALILGLNRKIYRSYNRVRENDFSLHGLMGFDLSGRTVGVIGTGNIGSIFAKIMLGFNCKVIAFDIKPSVECQKLGIQYVDLEELYHSSDIISLHCPLTPQTVHLINASAVQQMKENVMLINTSRGAVVDTGAVIDGLKSKKIGYLGLDVYEEEADMFFEDLSDKIMQDDVFARLLTFPNVLITGHQGFFTKEAMVNIAETTLSNIAAFEKGKVQNNV
ncbi:MAG: 2-hydroxyacid dehydrogenase [Proteobacteria bacterium]|nr:2-hydroxyacid dehydrogenase [Pseudomonadota bacterium]